MLVVVMVLLLMMIGDVMLVLVLDKNVFYDFIVGFDPWNESRKALADLIQEETVSYPEHSAVNPPPQFTNRAAPGPHNTVPPAPSNCTPTAEEMVGPVM